MFKERLLSSARILYCLICDTSQPEFYSRRPADQPNIHQPAVNFAPPTCQDAADIAHLVLAGIDVSLADQQQDGVSDDEGQKRSGPGSSLTRKNRYVAILSGASGSESAAALSGRDENRLWRRVNGHSRRIVILQSFVVMDTGMQVKAGTVCDVIAGDLTVGGSGGGDEKSEDPGHAASSHIYVRFSHPEPIWAVLVGRLDGMATELQVRRKTMY